MELATVLDGSKVRVLGFGSGTGPPGTQAYFIHTTYCQLECSLKDRLSQAYIKDKFSTEIQSFLKRRY